MFFFYFIHIYIFLTTPSRHHLLHAHPLPSGIPRSLFLQAAGTALFCYAG